MIRNYFLVNLILITIICVLGIKLYSVLSSSADLPKEANVNEVQNSENVVSRKDKVVSAGTFDNISKLDLFRPSRSASVKEKKKTEKAPLKNPPKLFGTIILNDMKTAILEDPETKTTKVYKLNDSLSGYKISEILENKVVLSRDGDDIEVKLRDDKGIKPPTRAKARAATQRKAVARERPKPRRRRATPPRRRPTRVRRSSDQEQQRTPGLPDIDE